MRTISLRWRAAAGLAIALANASCMPGVRARGADAAPRSPRPPAVAASTIADPPPGLLAAPGGQVPIAEAALAPPPFRTAGASDADAARAVSCLTEAVYYEARSEPLDGQRAVAQVVLNRVRNPAFPASVCGVVHQRDARGGGCQFTYVCDGAMLLPRDVRAWGVARRIAEDALDGAVYAPAGRATFYHATSVTPWWASRMERVAAIGAHIFYSLGSRISRRFDFQQAYAGSEPIGATASLDPRPFPSSSGSSGVVVHRNAVAFAGVVVHHGPLEREARLDDGALVRVHAGAPPSAAATMSADAGDAAVPAPSGA